MTSITTSERAACSGDCTDRGDIIPHSGRSSCVNSVTYTSARANLAQTVDRVCKDHEPILIKRNGESAAVTIALDDFQAMEETAYLLGSPKNAMRLIESITSLEKGQGVEKDLLK